jgi:hypothetical protein
MPNRIRNLKIDEFSLVRGDNLRPANPEATVTFFKVAKENEVKETLAKRLAKTIREALGKAQTTRTSEWVSTSTSKEVTDDGRSDAEPTGGGTTTVVITDAVEKTAPEPAAPAATPVEKTASAQPAAERRFAKADIDAMVEGLNQALSKVFGSDPVKPVEKSRTEKASPVTPPDADAIAKAIAPELQELTDRLEKIEKTSVGSRVIKATGGARAADNSGAKFPEFAKFLSEVSGLSAGQRLSKTTISTSGWTYGLAITEAQQFIDYITDESVAPKACRTITMPDKKYRIDKIGLGGNVLVKGTPGVDPGDTVSVSGPTHIELDAEEILAIVSVGDDTLEDNIEGDAFLQRLLGMIARSAANELDRAAIHADTGTADSGILDRFDGWLKLAVNGGAHVIEAMGDDDRYWPGPNARKVTRLLKALPTKFRQDTSQLRLILHPDLYLDYNDELANKGYANAWASITGIQDVPARGIAHLRVPMLKTDASFTYSAVNYTDGTVVMLTDVRNLIFGVHRAIKIEPSRQPRKRCTDFVLSMRVDAQIENADAIAIYNHGLVRS